MLKKNAHKGTSHPQLSDWKKLVRQIKPVASCGQSDIPQEVLAEIKKILGSFTTGKGLIVLSSWSGERDKTIVTEAIAKYLKRDLYIINLSQLVSKYIGETEKNLRKVFDAAEECGAILFFDEADALFGKRSEVKDSHDRFANTEVNDLFQLMETYEGLAILATNLKQIINKVVARRIPIVHFPPL
jgi:ATP-dependent Zn protease